MKNFLAVRIPRHACKKVRFFENGKQVGELNASDGQWSVPSMTPEPDTADADGGKQRAPLLPSQNRSSGIRLPLSSVGAVTSRT